MAFYRTGIPRRESTLGGTSGTSIINAAKPFDEQRDVEKHSLMSFNRKNVNESFSDRTFNQRKGIIIRRWGEPGEQQFEQALKVQDGFSDIEAGLEEYWTTSAAGTGIDTERPLTDRECCAWLRIKAPNNVESGSTSGISAGNKKGCVYYWSIEGCNPSYWGCGSITAAGTGGSGAGVHQTSKGVVFIAPNIPDKETINCGRTVDTKIKVAILTADGKKQLVAGTGGWSGYGMGPGDELYDLFGPENVCDDTTTITTKAEDCPQGCAGVEIGFTSQHMLVSTGQYLSVVNASPDEEYTWELIGGGTLSPLKGVLVSYGAPPSNFNCEENALIRLKCNGAIVDTLGIAVYSKESESTVIGYTNYLYDVWIPVCEEYYGGCYGVNNMCAMLWNYESFYVKCNGEVFSMFGNKSVCLGNCFCCNSSEVHCSTTASHCGWAWELCADEPGWCPIYYLPYVDRFALGCCPEPPT